MEQAIDRQKCINRWSNTQLLHRLTETEIETIRSHKPIAWKLMENITFLPEDQRRSFANNYEDLSIPKGEIYENW